MSLVSIEIQDDSLVENSESFLLTLSDATLGIINQNSTMARGIILDNDSKRNHIEYIIPELFIVNAL